LNSSKSEVVIESVQLREPRDLVLVDALILPIFDRFMFGAKRGFPPAVMSDALSKRQWAMRTDAENARIMPSPDGETRDTLTVGVRVTSADRGSAQGLDVRYVSGGGHFTLRTSMRLAASIPPTAC
jgi:hypothetical protein